MIEHIYGIDYVIPSVPQKSTIGGFNLEKKRQKFYRTEIPDIFDDLEFDEDDEPIYSDAQLAFIDRELDRIDKGYWFFNNGTPTYITGAHYFYLNYWTLEDGNKPDYRAAGRRYQYFEYHCKGLPFVDGIIRSKKRREGATSEATSSLVRTAISKRRAFCGIVSKTGADAKKAFLQMVKPGFNELPIFLKPAVEDSVSKTEMFFNRTKSKIKKSQKEKSKGQLYDVDHGLGSLINYLTTALNSYDSGRLDEILVDEGGKFPTEVPVNEYWPIVRQVLRKGGRKVGFALFPSTSNKLTKGGKGFKILWDDSNQFQNQITGSGMYRYFAPAYTGYEPYIDEYGEDILEKPTPAQAKWMKEKYGATDLQCTMGAKEWLEYERSLIKDPDALNEHKRMYPFTERDAFDFENGQNIYTAQKVADQKDYLDKKPPKLRTVRFYRNKDGKADFVDDPTGMWKLLFLPDDNERWATIEKNGRVCPGNTAKYTVFCDPFKNTLVQGQGSKAGAFIGKRFNPLDPENSGLPIAMFWGRPKLRKTLNEQMLLAAEYYGADLCYESDFDEYIEFLMGEGKMGYAKEKPKSVIDPNRKKKKKGDKEYGVKSGDGFAYGMMIEQSVAWFEAFYEKIYFTELLDQLEAFDPEERTLFDLVVAFQLFCVGMADPVKPTEKKVAKVVAKFKTFNLLQNVR